MGERGKGQREEAARGERAGRPSPSFLSTENPSSQPACLAPNGGRAQTHQRADSCLINKSALQQCC